MKWYRNKEMLNETLEQNKNELQKYKHDKIVALLKDESNLIKDHLELLDENEKFKNALCFIIERIESIKLRDSEIEFLSVLMKELDLEVELKLKE